MSTTGRNRFTVGGSSLDVLHTALNAGVGITTVVEGVTGKTTRILALSLTPAADGVMIFSSGGIETLSGTIELLAKVPFTLPFNEHGWFDMHDVKIDFKITATAVLDGLVRYCQV